MMVPGHGIPETRLTVRNGRVDVSVRRLEWRRQESEIGIYNDGTWYIDYNGNGNVDARD